ncbi:hypothetical protein GCM10023169_17420 [Georgenia halophila]|uniref:KfrA N-terminal DNA-binding domain-containing protein n=1 Tax=Georgenia halophila TaxID=620889 RepID=A0ABP8L6L2_9MICO
MPEPTTASSPEGKAARAAEELAAEGNPVTNRAVRERARVSMAVAAEAARVWNELAAEQESVPDFPDDVRARFDGIWRAAYVAARQEFDEVRAGWVSRVETAQKDAAALTKAVAELEEQLAQEREEAHQAQRTAAGELAEAQARAAKAEGTLEAVTAERDRLLTELESARKTASS